MNVLKAGKFMMEIVMMSIVLIDNQINVCNVMMGTIFHKINAF